MTGWVRAGVLHWEKSGGRKAWGYWSVFEEGLLKPHFACLGIRAWHIYAVVEGVLSPGSSWPCHLELEEEGCREQALWY